MFVEQTLRIHRGAKLKRKPRATPTGNSESGRRGIVVRADGQHSGDDKTASRLFVGPVLCEECLEAPDLSGESVSSREQRRAETVAHEEVLVQLQCDVDGECEGELVQRVVSKPSTKEEANDSPPGRASGSPTSKSPTEASWSPCWSDRCCWPSWRSREYRHGCTPRQRSIGLRETAVSEVSEWLSALLAEPRTVVKTVEQTGGFISLRSIGVRSQDAHRKIMRLEDEGSEASARKLTIDQLGRTRHVSRTRRARKEEGTEAPKSTLRSVCHWRDERRKERKAGRTD